VRQVEEKEMRRLAGTELAVRTDQILDNPDFGCALYQSDVARMVISYGNRFAELPSRFPSSNYGEAVLLAYVPPLEPEKEMVSPVKRHLQSQHQEPIFTIAPRPSQPPRTVYPDYRR
jgi:hypothetical protein